jgi:hypothetical protein
VSAEPGRRLGGVASWESAHQREVTVLDPGEQDELPDAVLWQRWAILETKNASGYCHPEAFDGTEPRISAITNSDHYAGRAD